VWKHELGEEGGYHFLLLVGLNPAPDITDRLVMSRVAVIPFKDGAMQEALVLQHTPHLSGQRLGVRKFLERFGSMEGTKAAGHVFMAYKYAVGFMNHLLNMGLKGPISMRDMIFAYQKGYLMPSDLGDRIRAAPLEPYTKCELAVKLHTYVLDHFPSALGKLSTLPRVEIDYGIVEEFFTAVEEPDPAEYGLDVPSTAGGTKEFLDSFYPEFPEDTIDLIRDSIDKDHYDLDMEDKLQLIRLCFFPDWVSRVLVTCERDCPWPLEPGLISYRLTYTILWGGRNLGVPPWLNFDLSKSKTNIHSLNILTYEWGCIIALDKIPSRSAGLQPVLEYIQFPGPGPWGSRQPELSD